MSLSDKSNDEIRKLLVEYGIGHGPVVGSTRKFYERKLEKAMEEAEPPVKASSDKTYYREEEEEVTYITYHNPVKHEHHTDLLKRRSNAEPVEDSDSDVDTETIIKKSARNTSHSGVRYKKPVRKSGGKKRRAIQLLLLLAVSAAALYYAYCHVTNNEDTSLGVQ